MHLHGIGRFVYYYLDISLPTYSRIVTLQMGKQILFDLGHAYFYVIHSHDNIIDKEHNSMILAYE